MNRVHVTHELSELRRQVLRGSAEMFALAAQAGARKLLSTDDIFELRRDGKKGVSRRVTSESYAHDVLKLYAKQAAGLRTRIAEYDDAMSVAQSAPSDLATADRSARPMMPTPIDVHPTEPAPAAHIAANLTTTPSGKSARCAPPVKRGRTSLETLDGALDLAIPALHSPLMAEFAMLSARHSRRSKAEPGAPSWVAGIKRQSRLPDHATPKVSDAEISRMEHGLRDYKIAAAVAGGTSARDALEANGMKPTASNRRRAQRLGIKLRSRGDIKDARAMCAGADRTVLTDDMRATIGTLWLKYPKANAKGILLAIEKHVGDIQKALAKGETSTDALLEDAVVNGTLRMPSTDSIRRAIADLGPGLALLRNRGSEEYARRTRPSLGRIWATRANERWEIDHSQLNITSKTLVDGEWKISDVWATLIIDCYSRAVMALTISERYPDSMTIAIALRAAIRNSDGLDGVEPSGTPELLAMDNGGDLRSKQTAAFCASTGILQHFCKEYCPDQKPHVERFFRTLKEGLLTLLPGVVGGREHGKAWTIGRISRLLTVAQIRGEINRWVHEEYHRIPHSETREKPVERWRVSAPARAPIPERALDLLLVYTVTRRVTRGLISIAEQGQGAACFGAPCLGARDGQELTLRYNPDDRLSVLAYDASNTRFIGELWNVDDERSPYRRPDTLSEWSVNRDALKLGQRTFEARISDYHDEAHATDRQRKNHRDALDAVTDDASREALDVTMDANAQVSAAESMLVQEVEAEREELRRLFTRADSPDELPAASKATTHADADDKLAAEICAVKYAYSN